ncbi:hypothetical protein B0H14DRAFT_2596695 [Mycena olivaceomarginata]|nr:hypothetical protein B0H14DRAFT_2596695 [Mycena olivaceomarginata]
MAQTGRCESGFEWQKHENLPNCAGYGFVGVAWCCWPNIGLLTGKHALHDDTPRFIQVSVITDDLGDKDEEVVAGRAAHGGETCFYTLQQDKCCIGDGPMQLCAMEGIHNKEKEEEDKY